MLKSIGIVCSINFLVNFVIIQEINKLHTEANLPTAGLSKQLITALVVPNLYLILFCFGILFLKFIIQSNFEDHSKLNK